jgi:hypothetical protein
MSDIKMVDELAQFIRFCDGANAMGAGALAERIVGRFGLEQHSGMVSVPVDCGCGDSYPSQSYGAGFIHAVGNCPNCEAAKSAAQEKQPDMVSVPRAALIEVLRISDRQHFAWEEVKSALLAAQEPQ